MDNIQHKMSYKDLLKSTKNLDKIELVFQKPSTFDDFLTILLNFVANFVAIFNKIYTELVPKNNSEITRI